MNEETRSGGESALPSVTPKLPKIIRFEDLARCGNEVWIENHGDLYRLKKTRAGKLILTK
jgi:hemin uptake protein HemP